MVRYELESASDRVWFANREERTHEVVRSAFWSFDKDCYALDQESLRKVAPNCDSAQIVLTWDEQERDRMYPAVVTMQNGGVLVYAANIENLTLDRKNVADLLVKAPPGGVVAFRGRKSIDVLTIEGKTLEDNGSAWVYLGPDRFVEEGVARVLVDDGVPDALRSRMVLLAPRIIKAYSDRTGTPLDDQPSLYLTWSARTRAGRSLQADVVPGAVVRFTVSGSGWQDAPLDAMASFESTVAHELAHLWNAGMFRRADWAAPWLSEGGAEFFSVAVLAAIGEIDSAVSAERIGAAFTECSLIAAGRPWAAIRERGSGRVPYTCGLAIQVAVLAVAREKNSKLDPFGLWRDVWRATPRYYEAAFTQYLAQRGDAAAAGILQRMFTDPRLSLTDGLNELLALGGMRTMQRQTLPANLAPSVGGTALATLMGPDCGGAYGFYRREDHYFIDGVTGCTTFKTGMKVRLVEGEDLYHQPMKAIAAARSACTSAGKVRLATVDGVEIAVACGAELAAKLPNARDIVEFEAPQIASLLSGG